DFARVGQQAESPLPAGENELEGLPRVVRHRVGLDFQRTDAECRMTVDDPHIDTRRSGLARSKGPVAEPDRNFVAPGEGKDTADVVTMFMGYQYPVDLFGQAAQARQAPDRFTLAEAAIDHQAGCAAFDEQRVSRAAAAERREPDHCNCW
ncbi:MAG TPA: hypothetical protein PLQ12_09965, partial [Candidatus Defluviicoccus seviourii]|nr:hypothetical protein [Candidatus Defluviicoccus seviourii]